MVALLFLLGTFGPALVSAVGGDPAAGLDRLTVALLPFEDKTEGPKDTPWLEDFGLLLKEELYGLKSIRLVAPNGAYRQLKLKDGAPIGASEARKIGETVE